MNYILLDLEWDNVYFKKKQGFLNTIVEFGAVKLDEGFNEVDRFSKIVKSSVTNKLSTRFRTLTGITNEQMLAGISFKDALIQYKNWAGDDTITLTWSNSDLYAIYENCLYFTDSTDNAKLGKYVDLQSFFHQEINLLGLSGDKNQVSLSRAAVMLNINFDEENLHRAVDDSYISAKILKRLYNEKRFLRFIKNTSEDDFYKRLLHKPFYINDINSPFVERKSLKISCPECGGKTKRTGKWKYKVPWFISTFNCPQCHKSFKAGISFKRRYDDTVIRKKYFENKPKTLPQNV